MEAAVSENMVERVARAIERAQADYAAANMMLPLDIEQEEFDAMARAAIAAMRESTEAMVAVGTDAAETCVKDDPCGKAGKHVWTDMIDAALAKPPK